MSFGKPFFSNQSSKVNDEKALYYVIFALKCGYVYKYTRHVLKLFVERSNFINFQNISSRFVAYS